MTDDYKGWENVLFELGSERVNSRETVWTEVKTKNVLLIASEQFENCGINPFTPESKKHVLPTF